MIGHVPEFDGHDAEMVGHALPKYPIGRTCSTNEPNAFVLNDQFTKKYIDIKLKLLARNLELVSKHVFSSSANYLLSIFQFVDFSKPLPTLCLSG